MPTIHAHLAGQRKWVMNMNVWTNMGSDNAVVSPQMTFFLSVLLRAHIIGVKLWLLAVYI